jgi:hypothetical protein
MARKRGMGGPDMPRPGTPAYYAMEGDRGGVSGGFDRPQRTLPAGDGSRMVRPWVGSPSSRGVQFTADMIPPDYIDAPSFSPQRPTARGAKGRPTSGVIPVASLPAEPRPITQPNPMGRPDPVPMTVLQRAQMARPLSATPDRSPVSGVDMQSFRANYRATHKARLTPAQEALMARYLYDQNPNNVLFGDPQTLGLGR